MANESIKVRKRGEVTIPQRIREALGLAEGDLLTVELTEAGILFRPAIPVAYSTEQYTRRRKAEFLLNNATDKSDYAAARREVESMGLDPDEIPHERP